MSGALAEALALLALAASLIVAVWRPRGASEAVVAVPAAALLVLLGVQHAHAAVDRIRVIGPTVGFLAAILVFGRLCADAGVFSYLGAITAKLSRTGDGRARPRRLLVLVVVLAATITATLTLDATVVLLTPVVLATVEQLGVAQRPPAYACVRIANSGSLLLPVSNLTNLLAFAACGISFGRFAALMALPWILACALEWLTLRISFRHELDAPSRSPVLQTPKAPRYALGVLALTIAGFVISSSAHVNPAWAALGGCVLLLPAVAGRAAPIAQVTRLVRAASPEFCAFVLALAVIVDAATRHGLDHLLRHLVPSGTNLAALLAMAFTAAVLANLVNNLPATLALIPFVAGQPALALALLLGVNIGPNATYPGSLATLLWRRMLPASGKPSARQFHALGLVSTPVVLAVATVSLWCGVRLVGV